MKLFFLLWIIANSVYANSEFVTHPAPKEPVYLSSALYPEVKKISGEVPAAKSATQAADEKEVRAYQAKRTAKDCERAKGEILVSLGGWFGGPLGPLSEDEVKRWTPFFEQLRNDADYFVQKLKVDFPRERPFIYMKGIEPCVAKEVTKSYPSGHGVLSRLFARVLSDLTPTKKAALEARAQVIGDDRVMIGMHHRSDIVSGQKIGDFLYGELKKSDRFKQDLAKLN